MSIKKATILRYSEKQQQKEPKVNLRGSSLQITPTAFSKEDC